MSEPTNEDRAERARVILKKYAKAQGLENDDVQSALGDMLTDLRHLCAEEFRGLDFDRALTMSEVNFNEETDEEESEGPVTDDERSYGPNRMKRKGDR